MRDILFRGKDVYGNWLYGDLINLTDEIKQICNHTHVEHAHGVNPDTVGQFTGLTDKNGNKIFEGDIVVCKKEICGNFIDCHIEIGFVEMKYGAFGLHRKQGYYRPFKDWLEDYEYEIIGNIFDNPELCDR